MGVQGVSEYEREALILSSSLGGSLVTFWASRKSLAAGAAKHPPKNKSLLDLLMHTGRVQHPPHLLPQSGKEEDHPHQGQPGEQGQPPPAGGEVLHAL